MAKTIIIVGAGMGGMAAGIYGQMNGYDTRIFEMHTKPGGQCTSWKRQGYTFDPCIHHFFGCRPGTSVYKMWNDVGVLPRKLIKVQECTAVMSAEGKIFIDYYDLDRLKAALLELSPADRKIIEQYIGAIREFDNDKIDEMINGGNIWKTIMVLPWMLLKGKLMKMDMRTYAGLFSDPFLRRAFGVLVYSNPTAPLFFHLIRHAGGMNSDIMWPAGGAGELSRSMENRYLSLGGRVQYDSRVVKILVEDNKAVGIRLSDGSEHPADIIISNADGRKTILDLLGGRYINHMVLKYCCPIPDETPFAVNICLGVNRDLSGVPSSLVLLFDKPVGIAGRKHESIEAQFYGFDKSMAPPGKGTIKIELTASYSYWKQLYRDDRKRYEQEKRTAAGKVIEILGNYFPGIKDQVEVVDVYTLMTWERYMGGTQGWFNLPNRKLDFRMGEDLSDKKFKTVLPGLSDFYFAGVWATAMGSLAHNANSGKLIIRRICRKDGKKFRTAPSKNHYRYFEPVS
jgi:phytoene dehydrogenase-like protein